MAELLKNVTSPEVHATGLLDLGGMLLVKRLVDRGAMPVVGNNNLVSGGAKLLLGGLGYHMSKGAGTGRIGRILGGGVVLDGMDDIVGVVAGKIWGGGDQTAQQQVNPGAPR